MMEIKVIPSDQERQKSSMLKFWLEAIPKVCSCIIISTFRVFQAPEIVGSPTGRLYLNIIWLDQ